jgi:hypothetical protein
MFGISVAPFFFVRARLKNTKALTMSKKITNNNVPFDMKAASSANPTVRYHVTRLGALYFSLKYYL